MFYVLLPLGSIWKYSKGTEGMKVIKEMKKRVRDEDTKEIIPR
jgi:hypothetical protein